MLDLPVLRDEHRLRVSAVPPASSDWIYGFGPSGPTLAPQQPPEPPAPDPEPTSQEPQDVARRRDAVVDAARTLTDLTPAGVEDLVRRRWRGTRALEQADVDSFSADAIRQRELDVVDALDARTRRGVYGRADKHVSVSFPRGWLRRSLRAMSAEEVAAVTQRLRDRGWTQEQVDKHVVRAFRKELSRDPQQ